MVTISASTEQSVIEVFKLNPEPVEMMKCAHSLTLPIALNHATGGVLAPGEMTGDLMVVICGGKNWHNDTNGMCYSLSEHYKQVSGYTNSPTFASSLVMDNGKSLWLTGGISYKTGKTLRRSRYIRVNPQDGTFASTGDHKHLPNTREQHCMERVGPSIGVLFCGKDSDLHADYLPYTVNVSSMDWRAKSFMKIGRSQCACGVLKDMFLTGTIIVVAAGGQRNTDGSRINSVELLIAESEKEFHYTYPAWEFGPNLPLELSDSASATTADQGHMFVVGGISGNSVNSGPTKTLFKIHCLNMQCQWKKMDSELLKPSSYGLAYMLPSIAMSKRQHIEPLCSVFNITRGTIHLCSFIKETRRVPPSDPLADFLAKTILQLTVKQSLVDFYLPCSGILKKDLKFSGKIIFQYNLKNILVWIFVCTKPS